MIERARSQVAGLVNAETDDVRFTGGASEALRLALAFAAAEVAGPLRLAASRIEHPALLAAIADLGARAEVRWIEPDASGVVPVDAVADVLANPVDLLCLMAVNNEVGTIQPVCEAAALAANAGAAILVDASQAAGRIPVDVQDWGADYVVLSAHKIYGPKGVGALIGDGLAVRPSPAGAPSHDTTPNPPALVGFGEAARLRLIEGRDDEDRIATLRDRLQAALIGALPDTVVNGDGAAKIAGNLHVSVRASNDAVIAQLFDTVAISTGAACVSGVDQPSHVLQAMNLPLWRQEGALRISLGRDTTTAEVDQAAELIIAAVRKVRTLLDKAS
ncbi:aminotransferase class V-fold PLP-dependent enzyme [Brevundimonas sp.]|uniref:cysteine desulfurase family protein n=1 Tax=Brevundimonas sp. TaxID=1871086 RepID=UPI00258B4340|nr:aminotransferase class V-fold PLP-dependent enzyme [Brevundimonas sp.]